MFLFVKQANHEWSQTKKQQNVTTKFLDSNEINHFHFINNKW